MCYNDPSLLHMAFIVDTSDEVHHAAALLALVGSEKLSEEQAQLDASCLELNST